MRKYTIVFLIFITIFSIDKKIYSKTYFVATNGSDTNMGTSVDEPFLTITKAVSIANAGDTIFVRGGTYSLSSTISISTSKNGTKSSLFNLFAYPGERPLLDFSSMALNSSNRGIYLKAQYWYIKGFDIKGAGDNGIMISGSNNIIENCSFYENRDSGMQLGGGASYNKIINCDSYYNCDPGQGNADGFAVKLDVGTGNYFFGCRSWQNSDDGWDGYLRPSNDVTTTLENCWCFKNGYLKDGSKSTGNGNGYKMGGSDNKDLEHNFILKNCISFYNRVKGFDQNNNRGSMTIINCTAYKNGTNYSITLPLDSGKIASITNSISYGSSNSLANFVVQDHDSWVLQLTVNDTDFVSLDSAEAKLPRNSDGSLPEINFLHLKSTSSLIDAGRDIGLPYNGTAPDLGAFEEGMTIPTNVKNISKTPQSFNLKQNYPNPFNPTTVLSYDIQKDGIVILEVFNILGRKVSEIINSKQKAGHYEVTWTAKDSFGYALPSGIYIARLSAENNSKTIKMILLK